MKKKILSILLALCVVLSVVPMTAYAAEAPSIFASGDGESEATAYTIATLEQLEAFRDSVNDGESYEGKHIKLSADIDMSTKYGEGKGEDGACVSWISIGVYDRKYDSDTEMEVDSAKARPFKGTFDGDNHVIDVYINNITADYQGLFGYVANGGTVKNLGIEGEISGDRCGGVTAYNFGTVENCYNAAEISGTYDFGGVVFGNAGTVEDCYNIGTLKSNGNSSRSRTGGVVGTNYDGMVKNCYNNGVVSESDNSATTGGVVGSNSIGTIEGCYNIGTLESNGNSINVHTGGVVGTNFDGMVKNCYNSGVVSENGDSNANGGIVGSNISGTIEGCYNTYTVSGGGRLGGVVGSNDKGLIKDCYNTGTVSGDFFVGGVVGNNGKTVENCYNTGAVSGTEYVGGVVGQVQFGTVTNCYYLVSSCSTGNGFGSDTVTAFNWAEFKDQSKFSGFDFTDIWVMDNVFLGRPILKAIPEVTIKGDGKTAATAFEISDLPMLEAFCVSVNSGNDFSSQFVKLTADIDMSTKYGDGKGKDDAYVSWKPIGMFEAGRPFKGTFDGDGHVIDVYINTTDNHQGLFAYVAEGGTVKNLGVGGEIIGRTVASGVVGRNCGSIENCYNTSKVSGDFLVGGVVGDNNGKVVNCYNTGAISGDSYVGGVVGNNGKTVENCYNTGAVSGDGSVGGVVGTDEHNDGGAITNCYYLVTSCLTGIGSGNDTATAKSAAEFASGEVAYLLQGTQTEQVWGQTLTDESKDTEPVLTSDSSKKVYKVRFLNVDGSEYKAFYTNYNSAVTLPAEPTVDKGFKFDGWLIDGTESEFTATTAVTHDITLKAQQTRNVFNVTYKDGMGGVIFADQADSIIRGESTPAFKGDLTNITSYSFDGWDRTIASTVTKDVVYTATWKNKAANKLILDGNGGTAGATSMAESTTDEKSLVIGENTFTMAGYHFVAWNTLANGEGTAYNSGDSVNFTAIHNAETVTLYAQWEVNSDYTVTFDYGAEFGLSRRGKVKWTDKVLDGITAPSNNGYDLDGWFCNGKEVTASTTYSELVANDTVKGITVKAQWTVKGGFSVVYRNPLVGVLEDGNVKWTDKVLDGMTEPKQDGYRFDGWFCNDTKVMENTSYAELAVKDTVKSIELIAKWTDIENPSISGIENGKTYCSAQTVTVVDNGVIRSVTVNGNGVPLDYKMQFTLNPAEGEQEIIVTDTDGNTATMTVMVNSGHTGGTATCEEQAECEHCGEKYGELDSDNHVGEKVWTIDKDGHGQKWDCCDKTVMEKNDHSFLWGTCEICGYVSNFRIVFCICRAVWEAVHFVAGLFK